MAAQPAGMRSSGFRPRFAMMWAIYTDVAPVADETYLDGVIASLSKVGDKIGGTVKKNFDQGVADIRASPSGAYPSHPTGFTNACATRMSYVLNYSGVPVPKLDGFTVTGADHKNYIFRVRKMEESIGQIFGPPDVAKGPDASRKDFAGKTGIIAFDVPFADASGHVTLWNGTKAVDEDYFEPQSRHNLPLVGARLWICP